jgi:tripartite-type tricarboxylate transporter receptor subunit TctC
VKLPRRELLHLAVSAAALAVSRRAWPQAYPTRPITMIVPFPAGGPNDTIARIVAEHMRDALGQSVIIENVTGGSGSIGIGRAARAIGDGYTVCTGGLSTHVINGAVYSLSYDVVKDFEPISLTATFPFIFVAKKSLPASDLAGLIDWLKDNPDKGSAGNAGAGTPAHLAALSFKRETGTQFQLVPYRGNGPAMQDLLSGQLDFMLSDPAVAIPQVRAGSIKALAVTARHRLMSSPSIPTVDEAGMPGFYVQNWIGVFAPKGTSTDPLSKVSLAIGNSLDNPEVRSRLAAVGFDVFPPEERGPSALRGFQITEIERWWPIIKAGNIKPE